MPDPKEWSIAAFYRFVSIEPEILERVRESVEQELQRLEVLGLVLVAPEGINGTIAGDRLGIQSCCKWLKQEFQFEDADFKLSASRVRPFLRLTVDIREEIVAMRRPGLAPLQRENRHLESHEWHAMLESGQDLTLIDTRNDYEIELGRFPGAIDPGLRSFREWPAFVEKQALPKDKPILIYCTGGIRCEKAILQLEEAGYVNVFQLRNGILGYLEAYPEGLYEGECYVFDERVAVDAELNPSQSVGNCPGCGHPSRTAAVCAWCGGAYFVCSTCKPGWLDACSKTCKDRIQRHGPRSAVSE